MKSPPPADSGPWGPQHPRVHPTDLLGALAPQLPAADEGQGGGEHPLGAPPQFQIPNFYSQFQKGDQILASAGWSQSRVDWRSFFRPEFHQLIASFTAAGAPAKELIRSQVADCAELRREERQRHPANGGTGSDEIGS